MEVNLRNSQLGPRSNERAPLGDAPPRPAPRPPARRSAKAPDAILEMEALLTGMVSTFPLKNIFSIFPLNEKPLILTNHRYIVRR